MRLLKSKQGLRRSQFAQEIRGANLEKVLLVPIDVSKVLQKAMILNYYGEVQIAPFSFMVNKTGMNILINNIEAAKLACHAERVFIGIEATG
ncbi:IS110 family transposase, partial [Bacillus salitolerans]